jgi:hypothetical protein
MQIEIATHNEPIWRDRADFIIRAKVKGNSDQSRREQLWARQVSDNTFVICCIPFFVYDLALGDVVEVGATPDDLYLVQRVVRPSGRSTFRVWFGDSPDPAIRQEVIREVGRLGCLFEWSSENLLAIDAASDRVAQQLADFLYKHHQTGALVYETGRTRGGNCLLTVPRYRPARHPASPFDGLVRFEHDGCDAFVALDESD